LLGQVPLLLEARQDPGYLLQHHRDVEIPRGGVAGGNAGQLVEIGEFRSGP